MTRIYRKRNVVRQDLAGNYYCKHMQAITAEGLHLKSSIAAELAHRDIRIDDLNRKLTRAFVLGFMISREGFNQECWFDHLAPESLEECFDDMSDDMHEIIDNPEFKKLLDEALEKLGHSA